VRGAGHVGRRHPSDLLVVIVAPCVQAVAPLSNLKPAHFHFMCHQVYGRDTVFDADRLIDLLDAFETFTEASRSARGDMDLTEGELGWL